MQDKDNLIKKLEKENKNLKEDFKRHIDRINELTNKIDEVIEILENIYMLDNVEITNNAVHEIDKAIGILKESDSNEL